VVGEQLDQELGVERGGGRVVEIDHVVTILGGKVWKEVIRALPP